MRTLGLLVLLVAAVPLRAQTDTTAAPATSSHAGPSREYHGLVASASLTSNSFEMAGASLGRKTGASIQLGVRFCPLCSRKLPPWLRLSPLRLTPALSFLATDFTGLDPDDERFAFSHVDWGVDATYRVASRLRLFGTARTGKRTAERVEAGSIVNYAGSGGTAFGGGIEIPLIQASGRGIRLGFSRVTGEFDLREDRGVETPVPPVDYSAQVFYVGWSGRFTGIDLPWR